MMFTHSETRGDLCLKNVLVKTNDHYPQASQSIETNNELTKSG